MSTDNATVGIPNHIDPKKVLWGRQGLGPDFFGPTVIAEAIWQVFKTAELQYLHNFVPFLGAIVEQTFEKSWRVSSTTRSYPCNNIKLNPLITEYDLENVCGVGMFGTMYGLVPRSDSTQLIIEYVAEQEWKRETLLCDDRRKSEPEHMPDDQILGMRNERIFLTRSRKLAVFYCDWYTETPRPDDYYPSSYTINEMELRSVFELTPEGILDFCNWYGAEAGLALLQGFDLQLQSTNYRVREKLKENEKAEAMAKSLLARIRD